MKNAFKIHSLKQWFTIDRYKKTMNHIACIKKLSEVSEVLLNNFEDLGVRKNIHESLNYQLFAYIFSTKYATFFMK